MTEEDPAMSTAWEAPLDAALKRALSAPALPDDFRKRIRAALVRSGDGESLEMQRARLEREHRQELAELKEVYLRLRRRQFTALLTGTFAIGAGVTLLFPWLSTALGAYTVAAVAMFGGVVGLAIGTSASRVQASIS